MLSASAVASAHNAAAPPSASPPFTKRASTCASPLRSSCLTSSGSMERTWLGRGLG